MLGRGDREANMTHKLAPLVAVALLLSPAALAADEPITIKLTMASGPQSQNWIRGHGPWMEKINKEMEGAAVIKPFFGGVLATSANAYDRIMNGVVEMGFGLQGMVGGKFPGSSVADLPFVSGSSRDSSAALWALYENGLLAQEYAEVKPLQLFVYPQIALQLRKPVRTLEDVRGLKLSVSDKVTADTVEKLGGSPVTMSPADIYGSLQRGVIDGAAMQWPGVTVFKLQDVTSYHVDERLGGSASFNVMNKTFFASLPAKARKAIEDNAGYRDSRDLGRVLDENSDIARKSVEAMPGHTTATLAPAETERWKQRVTPVIDDWVARTPNGAKILATFREELAKSAATN
jgi:TRAP-type C4-dicarboxylate transport system substrate-binding protein